MKIKTVLASLVAVVAVSASSSASAGMYMFGGGGLTAHEYYNVTTPSSYKLGVGYMAPSNFGFEASYINFGTAHVTYPSSGTLSMSGTNLSGVFELPLRPLVMSFKLGLYNIDASYSGSATSSGLSWGFLIGYEASQNIMVFMDTEGFNSVDVTAGNWETPTLITFGVRVSL